MGDNRGISAGSGANVTGNAVASGARARAEVRIDGPVRIVGGGDSSSPQPTVEDLRQLLDRLITELARTGDPALPELLGKIGSAREELAAEAPRAGHLRQFAAWLGPATQGFTSLAALVDAVQKAVNGLF